MRLHTAQKVFDTIIAATQNSKLELLRALDAPADGLNLGEAFGIGHDVRTALTSLNRLEHNLRTRIETNVEEYASAK